MILFKKFNRLLCNDSITVLNIGTDVTFLNFMQAEEIDQGISFYWLVNS